MVASPGRFRMDEVPVTAAGACPPPTMRFDETNRVTDLWHPPSMAVDALPATYSSLTATLLRAISWIFVAMRSAASYGQCQVGALLTTLLHSYFLRAESSAPEPIDRPHERRSVQREPPVSDAHLKSLVWFNHIGQQGSTNPQDTGARSVGTILRVICRFQTMAPQVNLHKIFDIRQEALRCRGKTNPSIRYVARRDRLGHFLPSAISLRGRLGRVVGADRGARHGIASPRRAVRGEDGVAPS